MVNILIIDDNIDFSKKLMIYMNNKSDFLRVYGIATDGEEAIKLLNKLINIDLIILDLKMPKFSGMEVIENFTKQQKKSFEKSVIIVTGEEYLIKKSLFNNDVIYSVISKSIGFENICKQIEKLAKRKEEIKNQKIIKEKIIQQLLFLGYDISHKGTQYLIDIIYTAILNEKKFIYNLNKEVYPNLSHKYKKNIYSIKINIIRATNNMFYNCQEELLKKYFYLQDSKKPSTKTVINTIIGRLKET